MWQWGRAPVVECLLNYSGLTLTVSIWTAEQAFVMNHKPPNEKTRDPFCGPDSYNLQPMETTTRLFSEIGGGRLRFGALCRELTKYYTVGKEQTTAGREWEVIQDIISGRLDHKCRVVQRLLYLDSPKAPTARFYFECWQRWSAGLNKAKRGGAQWGGKTWIHAEKLQRREKTTTGIGMMVVCEQISSVCSTRFVSPSQTARDGPNFQMVCAGHGYRQNETAMQKTAHVATTVIIIIIIIIIAIHSIGKASIRELLTT